MQVVQQMPSGQAVPMLSFASHGIPSLVAAQDDSPAQVAMGQILATCLAAVRIELIPALSLAQAASSLLTDSLQPALAPLLQSIACKAQQHQHQQQLQPDALQPAASARSSNSSAQRAQQDSSLQAEAQNLKAQHAQHEATGGHAIPDWGATQQLLGCLLWLYHGAVGIYGQCAAMQPQIDSRPGQASGLPQQGSSSQAALQGTTLVFMVLSLQVDSLCAYTSPAKSF